jgi:GNAT superfamily N-acetyltransferase
MAVTIRKAGAADIAVILSMQNDLASEGAIWGYAADSPREWNHRNLGWLFLAVDGCEPVGFIYCAERPYQGECVFSEGSRILEIIEIYVRPQCRGAGVGRRMVDAVQSEAAASGFTHMRLYSAAKRFDDILAFYRGCGFAPWYLEMVKPIVVKQGAAPDDCGAESL